MKPIYLILIYLILINLFAVIITYYDKRCAIKKKWRVKESSLLLVSFLGGSICMYFTMIIIRHKTKHLKFMLGIPVIIIFQAIIAFCLMRCFYGA
ncbi:MAG: DUF1294 domain-containing protein [Ruminococcus sp.]